jgi:Icc-related predicted phosphoesterase
MRIVAISDTHCMHDRITVPDGDVLVHAGDACGRGETAELKAFTDWMFSQPHMHKVFVPGNHDWDAWRRPKWWRSMFAGLGMHCLIDDAIELDGVKFYGSPWQPEFCNWAFNLPRGKALAEVWARIPDDTNVLVTHGPPAGILDTVGDRSCGCHDLRKRVGQLEQLKAHVFGHIHYSAGSRRGHRNALFVNAAICTETYQPTNDPQVFDV